MSGTRVCRSPVSLLLHSHCICILYCSSTVYCIVVVVVVTVVVVVVVVDDSMQDVGRVRKE